MADLPPGWTALTDGHAFEEELRRELATGHQLDGKHVRAIARRHDQDDILFAIEDDQPAVAEVHLTWSRSPETDTSWPTTIIYDSVANWRAQAEASGGL